jgi:hypothetical protein
MEKERGITIVLWVIVIFGIFFLARGLTGNVVLEVSNNCSMNSDCETNFMCCNGFCNPVDICKKLGNSQEKPKSDNFMFDIIFGTLILIAVLIAFYGINRKIRGSEVRKSRKKKVLKKNKRR